MQYGIEGLLKGKVLGWELTTEGNITIFLPSDKIKATWRHKNSLSEITTTSEIIFDNKRVFLDLNVLQDLGLQNGILSIALELQTPFSSIQDVVLQLNHLHKIGQIDSKMKITRNGNSFATIETKYLKENGKITSRVSSSNTLREGPLLDVMNADYESQQNTAHFESTMAPLKAITLDATFNQNINNDIRTSLTISIPNKPSIELVANRQNNSSTFDVVMNGHRYGYDMEITNTNAQAKFILPSRCLKVSGSQNSGTTEGTFMWDAEKDETRKVGFRYVMRPTKDSMKAEITLMMSIIGKVCVKHLSNYLSSP
jgi:hypothetical protein